MKIQTSWDQRPIDVANLFNPACCCLLINRVCTGYSGQDTEHGLPYSISFVALPLLLHSSTVSCLPIRATSKLHLWLMKNPQILFGFGERAQNLSPFVREAISFGIKSDALTLRSDSTISSAKLSPPKKWELDHGMLLAYKRAEVLGKLLRQVGNVPTIYALFGIRP